MKKLHNWADTNFFKLLAGYWVLVACLLTWAACSPKLSPEQKQINALQDKLRANEERTKLLKEVRTQLPCDTVHSVVTKTDTTFVIMAGDTIERTITKYRDRIIVDRAAELEKSDSIAHLQYQFELMDAEMKRYKLDMNTSFNKQQNELNSAKLENESLSKFKRNVLWVFGGFVLIVVGIFAAKKFFL